MKRLPLIIALAACNGRGDDTAVENLDVSERLEQGVRAGVITDEQALFAGIAAEGQVGDLKIYNTRVQFIIQSPRIGNYMSSYGGGVIDADIVRPVGHPGHDIVNEWSPMLGLARYPDATEVSVVSNGSDGVATIRVVGPDAPLQYIQAAFEIPQPSLGLTITTDYTLQPDSHLLEVTTTLEASEDVTLVQPGDGVSAAREIAQVWESGSGYDPLPSGTVRDWTGAVSDHVSVGILAGEMPTAGASGAAVLARLMEVAGAFGEPIDIAAGDSFTYTRWYGVGAVPADFTDDWVSDGQQVDTAIGDSNALAVVSVDGAPWTLTRGSATVNAPAGNATVLADGRGSGRFVDLPDGSSRYAPYASDAVKLDALGSLTADPTADITRGRGFGLDSGPLNLAPEGFVHISADGPFEFRATLHDDGETPPGITPRPEGATAFAWSADGDMTVPLEPGTYDLVVHRGIRFEAHVETTEVVFGETLELTPDLAPAYSHEGWLLADPHLHASPSPDGKMSMEARLLQTAGVGLQLHFGTDHDHIADYTPLLEPLGLRDVLNTVVADEVSPFIRGHVNAYPLTADPDLPNGGAWMWYWEDPVQSTSAQVAMLRERHGDFVLQVNHPFVLGMVGAAEWEPGTIGDENAWTDDFQAVEVLNNGDSRDFLDFFRDITSRGLLVTPVGTSDAHDHLTHIGGSATWLGIGTDDPTAYTDDALRQTMAARRTVVTRGPFMELSIDPGSTVAAGSTLDVTGLSPSWIEITEVQLWQDGALVDTEPGSTASFDLSPAQDAWYAVHMIGTEPMAPVWPDLTPWAMSAPILVDVGDDGWTPPLPPLQVGR